MLNSLALLKEAGIAVLGLGAIYLYAVIMSLEIKSKDKEREGK